MGLLVKYRVEEIKLYLIHPVPGKDGRWTDERLNYNSQVY